MKKYRLIKEYPHCPYTVGDEVVQSSDGFYSQQLNVLSSRFILDAEEVENFPEFWERVEYEQQTLFKTEDGFDVCGEDIIYPLQIENGKFVARIPETAKKIYNLIDNYKKCVFFAQQKELEKYIEKHEKKISEAEIRNAIEKSSLFFHDALWVIDHDSFLKELGIE